MTHWSDDPQRIEAAARAPRLAMCFDFDGTLAPIAPRPELVAIEPAVRQILDRWTHDRTIRMATVTGRALADIRRIMPVAGMRLAGNHGLELDDGRLLLEPPPAYRDQLEMARQELPQALAGIPGAWIEDKTWTMTVHLRQVAPGQWTEVEKTIETFLATHETPAIGIRSGKAVLELRPLRGATKADAVAELLREWEIPPEHLWFFGDDHTDEDVFRRFPQGMMIRVQHSETTAAPLFLHDPADLAQLLQRVVEHRSRPGD